MSLYDRLFKPRRYTLPNGTVVEEKRSRAPLVILIVVALGALSVHITGFNFAVLVKKGSKFFDILTAMFPPNTGYLAKIWQPLWDTIKMSFLGSFVGAGGLGLIMNEKIGWREYDSLGMILIVLFAAVMVIEGISHWLRKRLT